MIPDVLVQVRVRVVLAKFEVGIRFRYVALTSVRTAVQVVQTGDVLLVLVDAVLDVFLRFGHDPVVVPAELGPTSRLVGGRLLPELAHAGLLGHERHDVGNGFLVVSRRCSTLRARILILHRGSRYQRVRSTSW